MKPKTKMKKKVGQAQKLAKLALADKPKSKPSPGYSYIKNVKVGELIETEFLIRAIVLEKSSVSTTVLVTNADHHEPKDRNFYLGKHKWGSETEVKIIGD